jgi:hypothetical protein
VEKALANGASVNAIDEKGLSPLGLTGLTPLGLAAAYGHKTVAEFLLAHGADLAVGDALELTPLHLAAEYGSVDVAKLLLDRGADIDRRDMLGATPLAWAALQGHKDVVTLLLARGAVVNAQSSSGKTPLHLAAAAGRKQVVVLLLKHVADPAIRNSDGQTPLEEMQASSLDPANKSNIAAALRPPPPKGVSSAQIRERASETIQPPMPSNTTARQIAPMPPSEPGGSRAGSSAPAPSVATQSPALPACWDVVGIARLLMQTNPNVPPRVLVRAIEQAQISMGCRQPPLKTECSWIGSNWTCTTK